MSIWFDKTITIQKIADLSRNTMADFLGLQCCEIGDDYLKMSMPVSEKTRQPYGLLHGGASCTLAETVGSIASALVIDNDRTYCVGLAIHANHLKSVSEGLVIAKCSPLHLGRNTHVWDIKLFDNGHRLICVSHLTVAIIPKDKN